MVPVLDGEMDGCMDTDGTTESCGVGLVVKAENELLIDGVDTESSDEAPGGVGDISADAVGAKKDGEGRGVIVADGSSSPMSRVGASA